MDAAGSLLLLFIFAILIFGIPIIMITVSLIETISERRESTRRVEDESPAEVKAAIEKRSPDNAGEWTPTSHMR
jgi:Sec-independent protein translocase protein TatA